MKTCLNCNKEISDKATFCSDTCSKAYRRRTKKGGQPGQNDPNISPDKPKMSDLKLTRTDTLFEQKRPGYYIFGDKLNTRKCLECGKEFKTSLSMLKECSPDCMVKVLNGLTGGVQ